MQIPTNPLSLLLAEIDSASSLRLVGDRVIFGARRSRTDTEWLIRQKVAECRQTVADIVHGYGGIVVQTAGDRLLCNLMHADAAFGAACAIQQAISRKAPEDGDSAASVTMQMGVKVALHYDKLFVEAGRLSGQALRVIEALIDEVESEQVLLTDQFADRMSDDWRALLNALPPTELVQGEDKLTLHEANWAKAKNVAPLAKPELAKPDLDAGDRGDNQAHPVTQATYVDQKPPSGLMERMQAEAAESPEADSMQTETIQITPIQSARAETPAQQSIPSEPVMGMTETSNEEPSLQMELRYKGRQILLDDAHRTITLRGGPARVPHARISLRDGQFILESLGDSGTLVRNNGGHEATCTSDMVLSGDGQISLSGAFGANAQVVEFKVNA